MRACIRRAAAQIGGSCLELKHDEHRLVVDVGLPLQHGDAPAEVDLPVPGLAAGDASITGVVLSHNHPDHAGLTSHLPTGVRVWGPARAQCMQHAGAIFAPSAPIDARPWLALTDGAPEQIGPFRVTPIAVDHSAYESYALVIEAGGRRLLYTGDLRAHGRKPGMWQRLIDAPPKPIHAMLMEGTTLSRPAGQRVTEHDVERSLTELCAAAPGMILALYSAHNIDRLVSVFRAAKRTGRTLVLDLYGAAVAAATGRATIPQPAWDGVRVFVPYGQRRQVIRHQAFDQIDAIAPHRIYPDELRSRGDELLLTMRGSMTGDLDRAGCLDHAHAVWSMWRGYLDESSGRRFRGWLDKHGIPLTSLHASGHASPEDLSALAAAVAPERLVPIHTDAPDLYSRLYPRVETHNDGEWWTP